MFCKSAKMFVMGFFELVAVVRDYNFTRKALFSSNVFCFVLFLIALTVLTACEPQAAKAQQTTPGFLPVTDPAPSQIPTTAPTPINTDTPSLTLTPKPTATSTATARPCLGFIATPASTPIPWSYADDFWDKLAISRLSVQGLECAAPQEIVSKLVAHWFETMKTPSPQLPDCGVEEYSVEKITITNGITSPYDILAQVTYHVKGGCGWIAGRGILEDNGWVRDADFFGVYRENGYFRLRILPGWGS
jgi:hypothetical protein